MTGAAGLLESMRITPLLLAATITTGLMAGMFVTFAVAIMPGLARTDDLTFVTAFQAFDQAIVTPGFMAVFLGAVVLTAAAAALSRSHPSLRWIVAALVLYLVAVVVTIAINVPLNDGLKAAGDPQLIADLAAVREKFDEPLWNGWNVVRAITSTAAFGSLSWALVLRGRVPATPRPTPTLAGQRPAR